MTPQGLVIFEGLSEGGSVGVKEMFIKAYI